MEHEKIWHIKKFDWYIGFYKQYLGQKSGLILLDTSRKSTN
jgi:hypothetical protein